LAGGEREKMKRRILETEKLDNKENKTIEKALEFEKRYRVLFDKMFNGFALCKLLTDKRGNPIDYIFLKVNRAFEKINSMKKKDVINKKVTAVFGIKDIPDLEKYAQVALHGKEKVFETYIPRYNKYFEISSYSPRKGYFVTIFEDISRRKKAEEKIQGLNKKLNLLLEKRTKELIKEQNYTNYLLENSPDFQVTLDNKGKIIGANRACEEIIKKEEKEELIGNSIYKYLPQEKTKKIIGKVLNEKQVKNFEVTINISKKEPLIFDLSGAVFIDLQGKASVYLSGRDITEMRRLQQNLKELNKNLEKKVIERTEKLRETQDQLIQSEKLSIIGQLAAGVAHEIRNPLATMNLVIEHLGKKCCDDFQKDKLELVQKNIDRINKIIQGLLTFSRPYSLNFTFENVNVLIEKLEPILENLSLSNIKNIIIIKKYNPKLPKAWVDSHHLEQVFLNLALNAIKAMGYSGELYISTNYNPEQQKIIIKFKDTGCGIAEENLEKIFHPFFTTRKDGTGLGLSICQMIIDEHKGNISVESRLGEGTTFTIFLPLDRRGGS
jgi:two-component system NtrC family sensor kinase